MKNKKIFLLTFLFAMMFFSINVFAGEIINHGTGAHRFRFDFDANGYPVTSVKVNGVEWVKDGEDVHEYLTSDNIYTIVVLAGKRENSFPQVMTPGGYDAYGTYDARPNPNDQENVVGDEFIFTLTLTNYNDDWNNDFESFGVRMEDGPEPTVPFHDVEGDITISISGEELEYHYVEDKPNEADVTYFKFGINSQHSDDIVPFTFGNAKYTYIDGKEPPKNVSKAETKEPIHYHYQYNDSGYVEFCVNGSATDEYTKIMINGVDYANQAPHTQKEVFERFGGQTSSQFCIKNVPYNENGYSVVVEGRGVTDDKKVAGFAWSYLTKDRSPDIQEEGDFAHGKLEFVHAKFTDDEGNDYEFSSASAFNAGRYHETGEIFQWANGDKNYPEEDRRMAGGNVLAPYGTELTVRIVPDAGYQLTSMTTSEHGFQATDEIGVYKISLTRENLKFNDDGFRLEPVFTKIGSEVQATSNKIKGGTINTNQEVQNGSLKLEVNDINVSEEVRNAFLTKASEQGFTVSNIVDISLYNAIYKGGKKDNNGNYLSWDTEVNNLTNKATIALELEDNMAGKDVALVHEEHDGTYKFVTTNYNSETNTIEFEEDNFSNFAIVVKDNGEEPSNPDEVEKVIVEFNSTGGTEFPPIELVKGDKVEKTNDPENGNKTFAGWYLDEAYHDVFDFNTKVTQNITLYAKWDEKGEEYNIFDDKGNSILFNEEKNHQYNLNMIDYLSFTKEQVMELGGITSEMYDQIFDGLREAAKKYGTLISFYEIEVIDEDEHSIHDGPFTIKIKLTSEMKKYNSFKLMFVNDDFKTEEPITLKMEGEYLTGKVDHLSKYILVGNVEATNPQTGDNINTWITILFISIVSLSLSIMLLRKRVKNKI